MKGSAIAILSFGLWAATATAAPVESGYAPAFAPQTLKAPEGIVRNQVLVLGSPHLSQLPDTFKPEQLAPLLDRLQAWQPTAIAVEAVPGLQCDYMRRYPSRYADSVRSYCPDLSAAQAATGLDVPAANAEAERVLASWPAAPTAAQRRRLAALWLAAGERNSAMVQWLRLSQAERIAADSLTPGLVDDLNARLQRRDESIIVAAALAAQLGLDRVWAVDDHTADTDTPEAQRPAARAAMQAAWDNPHTAARFAADEPLHARLGTADGVLAIYRAYNTDENALLAYRSDFGAALAEPSSQRFGRRYLGYWETRNLRMVANIRDALAQRPGTRMLAIVGASHKGYYEAYLNLMHDVELVSSAQVLD